MFHNGTPDSTHEDRNQWTQPGFIAAAAVVALLVLLGLVLVVSRGNDSPASHAARPAQPPAGRHATAAGDSVCGLAAGSQSIPTSAPKTVWKLRGTVAVPSAPQTYGPARVTAGVPSCFAHSPTGALFAMTNIQASMSAFAKQSGRYPIDKVLKMIAAGPGREVLKDAAAKAPVAKKGTTTPSAQIAGFNVVRYEPGSAVIDLAFAGNRPDAAGYVHGQSTMRWEGGDWKLELAQNGGPFDAVQPIADLTGYTPWRGI